MQDKEKVATALRIVNGLNERLNHYIATGETDELIASTIDLSIDFMNDLKAAFPNTELRNKVINDEMLEPSDIMEMAICYMESEVDDLRREFENGAEDDTLYEIIGNIDDAKRDFILQISPKKWADDYDEEVNGVVIPKEKFDEVLSRLEYFTKYVKENR